MGCAEMRLLPRCATAEGAKSRKPNQIMTTWQSFPNQANYFPAFFQVAGKDAPNAALRNSSSRKQSSSSSLQQQQQQQHRQSNQSENFDQISLGKKEKDLWRCKALGWQKILSITMLG
jgi:hypothetical protein